MITLKAKSRTDLGTTHTRRLRRVEDAVPAAVYGGGGNNKTQHIAVSHNVLYLALQSEAFYTQPLNLEIDGKATQVILKALQRHPYKDRIVHADFLRASDDTVLKVQVPIHCINQVDCVGVKRDSGSLEILISQIELSGKLNDIPEFIEIDVLDLELDQGVMLSQLALPEGIVITALRGEDDTTHDQMVVHVVKHRGAVVEDEDVVASDDATADQQAEGDSASTDAQEGDSD